MSDPETSTVPLKKAFIKGFDDNCNCNNGDNEGYVDQDDDERHDVVVDLSERQIEERTKLCKSIS